MNATLIIEELKAFFNVLYDVLLFFAVMFLLLTWHRHSKW